MLPPVSPSAFSKSSVVFASIHGEPLLSTAMTSSMGSPRTELRDRSTAAVRPSPGRFWPSKSPEAMRWLPQGTFNLRTSARARHLTVRALEMALKRRGPGAGLLHHSDQGCTYASEDYRTRLAQHGVVCSMSRRGNCYDNAVAESFFSTVKSEEGDRFHSYAHAKEALFDYIEVFYNQRRRHSTLGQISPAAFERRTGTHAA